MRGRRMTEQELDRQYRRAYGADRLPGLGLDRNVLGEAGRSRLPEGAAEKREEILAEMIAAYARLCELVAAWDREPSDE